MHPAVSLALASAGIEPHALLRPDSDIARRAFLHLCYLLNLPLPPQADDHADLRRLDASVSPASFQLPPFAAFFAAILSYMMDLGYPDFCMDDLCMPRGDRLRDQLDRLADFGEFRKQRLDSPPEKLVKAYNLLEQFELAQNQISVEEDRVFSLDRALAHQGPEHALRLAAYREEEAEADRLAVESEKLVQQVANVRAEMADLERLLDGDEQLVRNESAMYAGLLELPESGGTLEGQLQAIRKDLDEIRRDKNQQSSQLDAVKITFQMLLELEARLPNLTELARQASDAQSANDAASAEARAQRAKVGVLQEERKRLQALEAGLAAEVERAEQTADEIDRSRQQLGEQRRNHEREFEEEEQQTNARNAELDETIRATQLRTAEIREETDKIDRQLHTLEPLLLMRETNLQNASQEMLALLLKLSEKTRPSST